MNPFRMKLFVLEYSVNRISLYLVDIILHILNMVYFVLFVMIVGCR